MNYYPHHIDAFRKKTKGLTLTERGAYRELLDHYYDEEKPLPVNPVEVARIAGAATPAERKAVAVVLAKFFTLGPDGHRNKRADEEIGAYRARAETARENGAKGGRRSNPTGTQRVTHPVTQREPSGVPSRVPNGNPAGYPSGYPLGKLVLKELHPNGVLSKTPTETHPRANATASPGNKFPENQKQSNGGAWKIDDNAALEKARSLGIPAHPGETWQSLRNRIVRALAERDRAA